MEGKRRKDTGNFFVRLGKSFLHAINGIVYTIEQEFNILFMMIASIIVLVISFFLNINKIELCIVVICIGVVIVCEMVNSAIEATVDMITLEDHPLAKIAKDCGSSATLVAYAMALFVGCIIFIPKILELF